MAQQTKRKGDRKRSKSKTSESKGRKATKQRSDGSGRNKSPTPQKQKQSSNGGERKSEIRNQGSDQTVPERMYEDYTVIDPGEISDTDESDVVVDIPVVKVDEIHFELDDLEARVSLHAEVLDLVKLSVGVHVELGKVGNPEVPQTIAHSLEPVTEGAGKAVGQIGEGANQAVGQVGEGAGKAVGQVGEGAGQAVGGLGEGAGQAVGGLGQGAGALGGLAQLGGGGNGGGNGGEGGGNGGQGVTSGQIAKLVAKEIGAAASDEVKGTGAEGRVTVHDVEKAAAA